MRFSTFRFAAVLLAPLVVSAVPLKRTTDPGTMQVLNFAFVLENLETEFYKQGMSKFKSSDFSNAGFTSGDAAVGEITAIQIDESTHVTTIESVIVAFGSKPPSGCTFDFSSVLTDVSTMVTVARVVEHVGVAAYLGAAHLIQDPRVLTAAATIVTVESRHSTVLNIFESATAISQPFDLAFLPNEVLAIAGSFIKGCDLGIPANPALKVTNTGSVTCGTSLTFSSPALNSSTNGFHCQMLAAGMPFSLSLPISQCVVPQGLNGAVAIWITSDDQPLNGGVVDRQSNAIVAGPLLTFIDIEIDEVSVLIRKKGGSGSSGSGSSSSNSSSGMSSGSGSSSSNSSSNNMGSMASSFVSTTTVSPSDAAGIIASLPPMSTASAAGNMSMSMPSATSSAPPNNVVANGVSMVPAPTSSASA